MTICMGALCQDRRPGDTIVLASDRMVTWAGMTEFEHPVPKISTLCPTAHALIAGDALAGRAITDRAVAKLAGAMAPIAAAAAAVAVSYSQERLDLAEAQILGPRGLSLPMYYQSQQSILPQVTGALDNALATFNLGVEIIVAGVDSGGGHLHTVGNPGGSQQCHDPIGYVAIGSGAIHATQSMIGFCHSQVQPVGETVFRVLASKRRAELAPGVGRDTDLIVISADGPRLLTPATLEKVDDLCAKAAAEADATLQKKAAGLRLEYQGIPNDTGSDREPAQKDGRS
jgi:hypothetical protein